MNTHCSGVRWLSGSVLDMRLRGCGFESHRSPFTVSFSKTRYPLLRTGYPLEWLKTVDIDLKNQIKFWALIHEGAFPDPLTYFINLPRQPHDH